MKGEITVADDFDTPLLGAVLRVRLDRDHGFQSIAVLRAFEGEWLEAG